MIGTVALVPREISCLFGVVNAEALPRMISINEIRV